jgi:steroid delta-isomerase-like uncharacterized protein
MTRDDIVALFARRHDLLTRHDVQGLAALHAADGVLESPFAAGVAKGRDAIEQVYRTFFTAFSTAAIRQEQLVVDGSQAVVLLHIDGEDRGGLMGLPPTGRSFSLTLVSCCQLSDGLIARERRIYDFTGLLVQIGAVKAKFA